MGDLAGSVGSGIGSLVANSVGTIVNGITGAAGQFGALVPADPRVVVLGVVAVAAVVIWFLRR